MALQIICPSCQARLTLPEEHRGKRGRCPRCRRALTVGSPPPSAQPPVASPTPARSRTLPILLVAAAVMLLLLLVGALGLAGLFLLRPAPEQAQGTTAPTTSEADTKPTKLSDPKDTRPADTGPTEVVLPPESEPQPVELKPRPGAIQRPRRLKLPDVATDLAVGGAGRYLVAHIPTARKAAVIDVTTMQIQHFIPLRSEKTRVTAGRDAVVVANFETRKLQRWRLDREEMELQVDLPDGHPETGQVAMGSGSYGPVLLGPGPKLLDLKTLKPLPISIRHATNGEVPSVDQRMGVRVSADGQVFGFWKRGARPQQAFSLIWNGTEAVCHTSGESAGHVAPGSDGLTLYAARGRFTSKVESVTVRHLNLAYSVPAAQPGFWFVVRELRVNRSPIEFYVEGETKPFATLTDIEHPGANEWDDEDFCADRKMVFLPYYHLFVTLRSAQELQFHPVDVATLTSAAGANYLAVLSQHPAQVTRGSTLRYQVRTRSLAGSVVHRLDSGPPGMAITPDGLLTWKIPNEYASGVATGVVSLQDAAGLTRTHRVTLVMANDSQ